MRKLYKILLIILMFIIVSCESNDVEENKQSESEADTDTVKNTNIKDESKSLLEKDLEWMSEKNQEDLFNEAILQTREDENLGSTISYSTMNEEESLKSKKLFSSFQGDKFEFELGYFPPNADGLTVTSLHEKERKNYSFELPNTSIFNEFLDLENDLSYKQYTTWQLTAADLTRNGTLEIIYIGRMEDPDGISKKTIVGVYKYTGIGDVPFELVAHFIGVNENSRTNQSIYYTEGNEFVYEDHKVNVIPVFYENGNWYEEQTDEISKASSAKVFYYDENRNIVKKGPSETDQSESENKEESESKEETYIPTDPDEIDKYAREEKAAGIDAIEYATRSTKARRDNNYAIVEEFVQPDSPIDIELKNLIKHDNKNDITMTYNGGEVLETDVITSGEIYEVLIQHSFDIKGVKREGNRTFRSKYRMKYDSNSGHFRAVELIDDKEI